MKLYLPEIRLAAGYHAVELAPKGRPSDELLAKINALPGVQTTLTADDVIVRGCVVCNDRQWVDGRKRRIRTRMLEQMAAAAAGVPVMDDHSPSKFTTDALPWATTIDAVVMASKFGGNDLVARYYQMRTPAGIERDTQVMGGVIKEASVGVWGRKLECSVCLASAGECDHVPGATYDGKLCLWEYDDLEKWREWSAVYEGAAGHTRFFQIAAAAGDPMEDELALEQAVRLRTRDSWNEFMNTRQPDAWERWLGGR